MTSYNIQLQNEDTLKVGFNRDFPATGDQIVKDAEARISELIHSGELPGGKLLTISGKTSVAVACVFAHKLGHLYSAIAVYDPRLEAYVVVSSTTPDYPFSSRISSKDGTVTQTKPDNHKVSSVVINCNEGVLETNLNRAVQVEGDQIVQDTEARLEELINTGQLKGGKQPLLINGRFSVLGSFVIALKLAHLYSAIAVYDPKIGDSELDKYIVVISHNGYQVGETIDVKPSPSYGIKVVLCGEANTGKTCLKEGLKNALLKVSNAPNSYVFSGCPDGEGAWFSETAQNNPELARQLKEEYKARFTPEFAHAKAQELKAIKTPILVFDVGGKITHDNETIMSNATHAVILTKSEEDLALWQEFCYLLELPIVAILYSDYQATEDHLASDFPLLKGTVHYLERGEDTSTRPMIQKLAQSLVDLFKAGH